MKDWQVKEHALEIAIPSPPLYHILQKCLSPFHVLTLRNVSLGYPYKTLNKSISQLIYNTYIVIIWETKRERVNIWNMQWISDWKRK